MNIQIITISHNDDLHKPWDIFMDEIKYNLPNGKRTRTNNVPKYYIESADKNILQKIKIGYPFDAAFDPTLASVGDVIKNGFISQQTIQVPYTKIYTNPMTLNLFLADPITDNDEIIHADCIDHNTQNGIVILILGREYKYIRSSVSEDIGEIISTFYNSDIIGCIILLNNERIKEIPEHKNTFKYNKNTEVLHEICYENVLCCDTKFGDEYIHIRLNISRDEKSDTYLYPMIGETILNKIKNPNVVSKLDKMISDSLKLKNKERKFVRSSKRFITNYFIVSNKFVEEKIDDESNNFTLFIEKHDFSEAINQDNEIVMLNVNTDEEGYIINDDTFKEVLSYMKQEKIKAFTLVGCKSRGLIFTDLRPSYIFIMDETESLIDDNIKTIKCIKSN